MRLNNKYLYIYLSLLIFIIIGCDSNPTNTTNEKSILTRAKIGNTVTDSSKYNLDSPNTSKDSLLTTQSNISISRGGGGVIGCGITHISFGTAGGNIGTSYTPYEYNNFISSYNSEFNSVSLTVSLDGNVIGFGSGGFQVDQEVGLGSHTITVNARTSCSGRAPIYVSRQQSFNIELVPPPAPDLKSPSAGAHDCSAIIHFDYSIYPPGISGIPDINDHNFHNLKNRFQIDDNINFSSPEKDHEFSPSYLVGSGDFINPNYSSNDSKKYYWRAQSRNDVGVGSWSEVRSFTACGG